MAICVRLLLSSTCVAIVIASRVSTLSVADAENGNVCAQLLAFKNQHPVSEPDTSLMCCGSSDNLCALDLIVIDERHHPNQYPHGQEGSHEQG